MFPALAAVLLVAAVGRTHPPVQTEDDREEAYARYLNIRQYVRGDRVEPHWLEDGDRFWFVDRGTGRRSQRRLVDPRSDTVGDLSSREARSLPLVPQPAPRRTLPPPAEPFPAPDGSRSVRNVAGSVLLELADGSASEMLIDEGRDEVIWSVTGPAWSPDGRHLAVVQVDTRQVHEVPIVDYSEALEKVTMARYAKTGDAMGEMDVFVVDVDSGRRVRLDAGADRERYLFFVGWRKDGSEVLFLRLSRRADRLDLMAADPETGTSRVVLTERQETFVGGLDFIVGGWVDQVTPLADGERFLWLSERDGWRHVYLYDFEGRLIRRLTEGEFPVLRVAAVDEERERVYFTANGEERLYDTHLYAVGLDGRGFTRLTDTVGHHAVELSPSNRYFVDTHSTPSRPTVVELRSVDGERIRVLSRAGTEGLEELGWRPGEEFVVKAADGETDLYGVLYRPYDFEPTRSYPVVEVIYQGPFITMVPHTFVSPNPLSILARALAQAGFVTFIVDGRGTTGRSKAFQDAVFKRIGQVEIPDHVATLRQLGASRPWMDLDRVGIFGHSWGGYFALHAMLTAPDTYHVGIASAPGDLTEAPPINEPYMRLPADNPEGYARGSNPGLAANLEGKLLLVHGTADTNAPFSTTMRMVAALVEAGKPYDLLVYPQASHSFQGRLRLYNFDALLRYFREHLWP